MLVLWLAGLGIPATVLVNERVKTELAQNPPDPKGVYDAIYVAACGTPNLTRESLADLHKPQYQLECLSLVESNGEGMTMFGELLA